MAFKKEGKLTDLEAERISRAVSRAASMSEGEADQVASAPFLYARIRAQIAAEAHAQGSADGSAGWLAPLLAVNRLAAGLATAAIMGAAVFWAGYLRPAPHQPAGPRVEEAAQVIATACSLSSTEACAVSSADVIEVLMGQGTFESQTGVRR